MHNKENTEFLALPRQSYIGMVSQVVKSHFLNIYLKEDANTSQKQSLYKAVKTLKNGQK